MYTRQSNLLRHQAQAYNGRGLFLRGVVLATYVQDDPVHPEASFTANPGGVFCDVYIYSGMAQYRHGVLPNCMVTQVGGCHDGHRWLPKATSHDFTGSDLDVPGAPNLADFDGDHVVVSFLDGGKIDQPIILGTVPHPSEDNGKADDGSKGHRKGLKLVDGRPDQWKHHGTLYGVEANGDFTIDSRFANDGQLDASGAEAAPPTDGKGAHTHKLPKDARWKVELHDMSNPASPLIVAALEFTETALDLGLDQGAALNVGGKDSNATLTVGDGAVSVTIADRMQTFWASFKSLLQPHVHPSAMGPTGPTSTVFQDWDTTINSTKITIPDL